jgi:hypothetical protein
MALEPPLIPPESRALAELFTIATKTSLWQSAGNYKSDIWRYSQIYDRSTSKLSSCAGTNS